MSSRTRERPRVSHVKEDSDGEINILWTSIVDKIRKAGAINKKYQETIPMGEEKLWDDDEPPSIARLEEVEKQYREGLKLAEEELKILNEEPDDLIKNLEMLISVRAATETDVPRSATTTKPPRTLKRRLDAEAANDPQTPATPETATPVPGSRIASKAASRSGSVAASSIKSETGLDPSDGVKGATSEKQKVFKVGDEVFYKTNKKVEDGEGILCRVTSVTGEGKQRRYEILDLGDPEEAPWKASVQHLVAIPPPTASLPDLPKGKQVLALYPDTTTFYKAEMVGMKKDLCRLKFEGEDEKDKEQEVDRRYVLDGFRG